uniref:Uncharacterized protein n=1 Tax=Opuntia streptacantha TaxID=393608 RepID=A0A7C8YYJ8_OPUST
MVSQHLCLTDAKHENQGDYPPHVDHFQDWTWDLQQNSLDQFQHHHCLLVLQFLISPPSHMAHLQARPPLRPAQYHHPQVQPQTIQLAQHLTPQICSPPPLRLQHSFHEVRLSFHVSNSSSELFSP